MGTTRPRTGGEGVDDREANRALIRAYWDAVNAEDYATLASLHDPAARNHAPAAFDLSAWPPEGNPFGPVEVRETYQWIRAGQPDLRVEVEAMIAEGDQVVAWVRATSTLTGTGGPIPPTGARLDFHHAHRFRIADGRIVEHWAVRDDLRAMLQAGVVEPPHRHGG
jgi:predicted ester cyclase